MLTLEMTTRVSSARFVGRTSELAELEAALLDAAAARPSLAFVAGESGMGKTRLLAELEARAADQGVRVLRGDCVEVGDGELPYAPLVGVLRPLARDADPVLDTLPAGVRAELARLLPALGGGGAPPPPDDGAGQGRVFEALLALLDALGAETPVLLAIEDVHWADRSTRAFLAFLARSLASERVLAVATYRSDELHRRHPLRPLLADLERDARVRRVELAPLGRDELAEVLEGILGSEPAPDLVARLLARSEGNPLFLEELLAGGLDGRGSLPGTLRDALMVRIERLDDEAQEVLRALAVGGQLDHDVLADVTGLGDRDLRDALRQASAGHIVVPDDDGRLRFRHALLREVVEEDLLPGERASLHRSLARALAARPGAEGAQRAARIAHHHAASGDRAAALASSVRAAAAAEDVHAYGEAASLLERAIDLFDLVEDAEAVAGCDRVDLLARAADAHAHGLDRARSETLLRAALAEVDPVASPRRAAGLLEDLGRTRWSLGRGKEAVATAEEGLALLDPSEPTCERASLLAWIARARMLQGRFRDAERQAGEAITAADAAGDRVARGHALNTLGVSLMHAGAVDEGRAALREALALAEAEDRPADVAMACLNLADALHLRGRSAEAWQVLEEGGRSFDRRLALSRIWHDLFVAEVA